MMSSSPTPAPYNRASIDSEKALQPEQRTSVRQPEPYASSRGFLGRLNPPPVEAKTEKTGFLHLPNDVRETIYELTLFDHDRSKLSFCASQHWPFLMNRCCLSPAQSSSQGGTRN